jgi:predicted ArsR family transcriptional regulator
MMAVGLIEMLKAVEERFGEEGHDAARAALRRIGARIATEMIEGVEIPEELSREEVASLYASWINEVVYASIERPSVGDGKADFDIHYCPHEDVYGAFDCRVQRYFVEGMIDAGRALFGDGTMDVAFATTIPSGSHTCHFDIFPKASQDADAWTEYSDRLRSRALLQITPKKTSD